MRKLAFLAFVLLSAACARQPSPVEWPFARNSLIFSGVLHSPQGDIPLQGALKDSGEEVRYAVIMQNGILLGSGSIGKECGSITPVQLAPSAGPAVKQIGKALYLFLGCRVKRGEGCTCPWKEVDKSLLFQDKRLELAITLQDAICLDLK